MSDERVAEVKASDGGKAWVMAAYYLVGDTLRAQTTEWQLANGKFNIQCD